MTEAEKILSLIESVSPHIEMQMAEIDARVYCYLNNFQFDEFQMSNKGGKLWYDDGLPRLIFTSSFLKYTRSRDALKSIRPDGWRVEQLEQDRETGFWICSLNKTRNMVYSKELPTEELAELHSIIQAIAYTREVGE